MPRTTELEEALFEDEIFHHPAPHDVWHYESFASWKDVFWGLISDVVDEDVKEFFVSNPPDEDDFSDENFDWLSDLLAQFNRPRECILGLMEERVRSHYQKIRCYHATRTDDIASFHDNGLLPLDLNATHDRVRRMFLTGEYPEITESIFNNAVEHSDVREYRVNRERGGEVGINFVLNKYISIRERCNEYLKYGSEYTRILVQRLSPDGSQSDVYVRTLSNYGQPILFICDVPINITDSNILSSLVRSSLYNIFKSLLEDMSSFSPDGGTKTSEGVPSDAIVGHAVMRIP